MSERKIIKTNNGIVKLKKGNLYSAIGIMGMGKDKKIIGTLYYCDNNRITLHGEDDKILYDVDPDTMQKEE